MPANTVLAMLQLGALLIQDFSICELVCHKWERATQFRCSVLFLFTFFSIAPVALPQEPAAPPPLLPPAIRVRVNEVSIGVTVTSAPGTFVKGLRPGDFRVFDNGVPQPITSFLSDDDPGLVVLLLETGPGAFFQQGQRGPCSRFIS